MEEGSPKNQVADNESNKEQAFFVPVFKRTRGEITEGWAEVRGVSLSVEVFHRTAPSTTFPDARRRPSSVVCHKCRRQPSARSSRRRTCSRLICNCRPTSSRVQGYPVVRPKRNRRMAASRGAR